MLETIKISEIPVSRSRIFSRAKSHTMKNAIMKLELWRVA